MGTATVRTGIDTWTDSSRPTMEFYGDQYLQVSSSGPTRRAFVYASSPVPRGATVLSAQLVLRARGASSGAKTLTAQRVSVKKAMSQVNDGNQPAVTGTSFNVAVSTLADKAPVTFDVTSAVQAFAAGTPNYGFRIASSSTSVLKFYGFDSAYKPYLQVTWSDAPKKPTDLRPSSAAVGLAEPTLVFNYTDVSGNTNLAACQVQIDPAGNGAAPAFDSGTVATTIPQLDLNDTAYAGLANAATTQWRVRVQDGDGLWSDWSDWVEFSRQDKGAVTITNPAADPDDYVSEATPPITWTFSGSQAKYQVLVASAANPSKTLWDSGVVTGAATSQTVPNGVLTDPQATYRVTVRVYDSVAREATPGDAVYAWAARDFTYQPDATVTPPSGLTTVDQAPVPRVLLQWTRGTAPDRWEVYRDGRLIASGLAPEDTLVSGTTHQWLDTGPAPTDSHTYWVRAVVNNKASVSATLVVGPCSTGGVYLLDPAGDGYVPIAGDDGGSWDMPEEAEVFAVLGASQVVRVVTAMRGLEGSLSGVLVDGYGGLSDSEAEEALLAVKASPTVVRRLSAGDVNIPVIVGNVTVAPTPVTRSGQVVKDVSFSFWQAGELPFDAEV